MIDFSNVGLVNMPSKEVLSVGLTCFYCQKSVDSESVSYSLLPDICIIEPENIHTIHSMCTMCMSKTLCNNDCFYVHMYVGYFQKR